MTRPVPFQFGRDFRQNEAAPEADRSIHPDEHQRLIAQAEEAGFSRGLATGRDATMQSQTARIAEACERIAEGVAGALAVLDAQAHQREADAVQLALVLAQKLGGTALAKFPFAEIEAAAVDCFSETRNSPHVVIRIAPDLVEEVEQRLAAIAAEKGFTGRLIVLGEPEVAPGDARLEWADGGVVRDRSAILAAIAGAVERHLRIVSGDRS
jgi:flagellar assembly protein FliH